LVFCGDGLPASGFFAVVSTDIGFCQLSFRQAVVTEYKVLVAVAGQKGLRRLCKAPDHARVVVGAVYKPDIRYDLPLIDYPHYLFVYGPHSRRRILRKKGNHQDTANNGASGESR